ncbi:hypothetical protein CVIRNUC_007117 [Coccomyxa viridis]|uniref:BHLH domain-containing protein n=1 Tax=Coccomyxa viridis TaxID=1274662 RepID=A0AAV1I9Z0_9CHLO|nr:hypothetical protein CVIRNUC_007117 [Coccomyxa viridis]
MDPSPDTLAASMHAQLIDPNVLAQLSASAIPNGQNALPMAMASPPEQRAEHDEPPGSGFKTGSLAKEKHSATEKRRRDRIAEGMTQLKDAVLPGKEKEDQAGFLRSAANYIRQLQEALSHLQAMGAVAKLPEDAQWSIRALLMRRLPQAALPRAAAPPPAGADAALPQLLGYLLQQMSKEPGSQDEQQLQASMAQAALMHQMQTQYQSYFQQCVQTQQTPSPTPGQLQALLQQQRQPPMDLPRTSSPALSPQP